MKSTDKFVLVLVASLALLLAGCGGGSSSNNGDDMDMDMDMSMEQKTALMNAHTALQRAVNALVGEATQDEVNIAMTAATTLENAINAATDVAASDLAMYRSALTSANTAIGVAQGVLTKENNMAMVKVGKALRAALGGPTAGGNALANNEASPVFQSSGDLRINAAAGAGALTTDPGQADLKAGDAAGSLGSWMGMDYALTAGAGATKVTNEARVYSNRGAPKSIPFANEYAVSTVTDTTSAETTVKGYLALATGLPNTITDGGASLSMATAFTHSGTQNHKEDTDIPGTFDGASGNFLCSTGTCTTTNDGKGGVTSFGGTWHFKPDSTAMLSRPDANYLYYGWWVSKDKDGGPTAASAFVGTVGTIAGLTSGNTPDSLAGSATYAGHAAGKFAMSNPLDGTGSGGHFTADAELKATFGANDDDDPNSANTNSGGITGTIDNFRLNDGSVDPGWSVELHRASWGSGADTFATPNDQTATTNVDESMGTTWSINDNASPRSGAWSGQMYDEMPGNAPTGDGSTVPTTVTGTFYSEFSAIGRMVGAFGAEKE